MPRYTKLNTYESSVGITGRRASHPIPCGVFSSRTIIVIRIAITPSLNASSLALCIAGHQFRTAFGGNHMHLEFRDLMEYTEWERKKCHEFLRRQDPAVLKMTAGPHGDGRMQTIGDIIRHVFMAEKRYVERLTGRPLTEFTAIPSDNLEALFEFGVESRREYKELLESFPADEWDKMREMKILAYTVKVTPKKIV